MGKGKGREESELNGKQNWVGASPFILALINFSNFFFFFLLFSRAVPVLFPRLQENVFFYYYYFKIKTKR